MKNKKIKKMTLREGLRKVWNFIWKDESIWGWLIAFVLAFVIVKFIFFPFMALALSTKLPLVVVESSSMKHPGNFIGNVIARDEAFDNWWASSKKWYIKKSITKKEIENWSFKTGLDKGDIVIVKGKKPEQLKVGDVIIFGANQKHPVIHRIINIKNNANNEIIFETKGDNNPGQLFVEKNIPENVVVGKAIAKIPKIGWIKLFFVEIGKKLGF